LESYTQAIIAMLAVINPVVCAAMLVQIQPNNNFKLNSIAAIKAMTTVLFILLIATFGGRYILSIFGISMDAFKIVGGIIIGFIGFQMLFGITNGINGSNEKGDLSKLIIFAASPGTIAMVITLAAIHNGEGFPLVALVGVVAAIILSLGIILFILFSSSKKKSKSDSHGMVTKFMGLIIAAMGLQFLLDGIKNFFGV
jgi:multiple antibiotic resistance protein